MKTYLFQPLARRNGLMHGRYVDVHVLVIPDEVIEVLSINDGRIIERHTVAESVDSRHKGALSDYGKALIEAKKITALINARIARGFQR